VTVHTMQKSNRVKKTKAQKAEDKGRLVIAMHDEHFVLSAFCNSIWDYEWQVQRMSVEDYTSLMDVRDKVCSALRIVDEEFIADTYRDDVTGEYDGENTTLRSMYAN